MPAGLLNTLKQQTLLAGSGIFTIGVAQTPTLTFKAKLCTVSGCGSGTVVTLASLVTGSTVAATNNPWNVNLIAGTAAIGATGNLIVHGFANVDIGALNTAAGSVYNDTNTAVSSNIDLTAALFLDFTATTSTGSTGNIITQQDGMVQPNPSASAVSTVFGQTGAVPNLSGDATTSGSSVVTVAAVAGTAAATIKARSFGTTFGDTGGSALTSGSVVYFTVPYACTIAAWNATVDAGTVTFDIWKIATGTAIPTVTNTITASALPAISTGTAIHSTTLTAWTTTVTANDIFGIQLKTVATAKYAELDLQCNQ